MHNISISVALCTYNGGQYIREQLRSIVDQSLVVDEIVICDDGSTDDTIKIIREFIPATIVKIHLHENKTTLRVKKNFEKALSLCKGAIVFLADQDDLWEFEKVKRIVQYFDENPGKNVVFTNGYILNETERTDSTIWEKVEFAPDLRKKFQDPLELLNFLLSQRNLATGATMALRSHVLKDFLPFPGFKGLLHDYLLALQAAVSGSLGYMDDCLISYRLHSGQQVGFNKMTIPFIYRPFYKIPAVGIKAILARRIKKERQELVKYLQQFVSDKTPVLKDFLKVFKWK